ncbi:MAG: hypothetical protein RL582_307, partial [Bacteroidota bacterium]
MSILDFIKGKFSAQNPPLATNKYYQIRQAPFFLDEQSQAHYLTNGWALVNDVVTPSEIASFMETFEEISQLEGFELDKNLLNSGRLFNPEIRKKTQD